jgi:hypothetical protein
MILGSSQASIHVRRKVAKLLMVLESWICPFHTQASHRYGRVVVALAMADYVITAPANVRVDLPLAVLAKWSFHGCVSERQTYADGRVLRNQLSASIVLASMAS